MKFTKRHTYADLVATEKGRAALEKFMPNHDRYGLFEDTPMMSTPLAQYGQYYKFEGLTEAVVEQIVDAMNGPIEALIPDVSKRKSLDELDIESFKAGPAPLEGNAIPVKLQRASSWPETLEKAVRTLDGEWMLAAEGEDGRPIWAEAVPAPVPGSVHTALMNAGKIPDTTYGRNQEIGRLESYKNWWYKRTFSAENFDGSAKLTFDGVANKCTVWLNGERLGGHEGMFGGPEFDISGKIKPENELIVKLDAIPEMLYPPGTSGESKPNVPNNQSWKYTVVSNNVYGWHYSCMPSIGIWNSVRIEQVPDISLPNPFIATRCSETGKMRMAIEYTSRAGMWSGKIVGHIAPENFEGDAYTFEMTMDKVQSGKLLIEFEITDARLWWPNNLGEQNLYALVLAALPEDGKSAETVRTSFGVRTVKLEPLPCGPRPDRFNWQFVVNGKRTFIKGTGWCTMDANMDFSDSRYERFLSLARDQNCQMIRAWGAGMPEKDIFYELCNRYGIMVMQEWPTAWDSHETQPYEMLEETVILNTLRIRNNPSLILYCPGNESPNPFGRAIDMMGRLSVELDGTRPFHRGEPYGGSMHNYNSYWGRQSLDFHATMTADFWGEFGIACMPVKESVNRYLPAEEQNVWPAKEDGAFEYHTPIFGTAADLSRLRQTSGYFTKEDCSFDEMILGSQLSQVVGVRHTLERSRIRYPDCGGALYYKLNDNFPAMSWATVDFYGVPKIGHYVIMQSFSPVGAYVLPTTMNFTGSAHRLPVYLVDDLASRDAKYEVDVRVYDGKLQGLIELSFAYEGDVSVPDLVGEIVLPYELTNEPPLFVAIEVLKNGERAFDTFYFFNYEAKKGCLFTLPEGAMECEVKDGLVTVRNVGHIPLVGVNILRPGHADSFTASENFFWLEAGQEKRVRVNAADGVAVEALNAGVKCL